MEDKKRKFSMLPREDFLKEEQPPKKKQKTENISLEIFDLSATINEAESMISCLSDDDDIYLDLSASSPSSTPLTNNISNNTQARLLPPGWITKITAMGNTIYQNPSTGEISTVFPESNTPNTQPQAPTASIIAFDFDSDVEESETDLFANIVATAPLPKSILDDDDKTNEEETPEKILNRVQEGFTVKLFEHQKEAIIWMRNHENHRDYRGGILADDMGCGKTLSMLGLMLSNPNPNHERQHTLLVVPFSLLLQWRQEISDRTKKKHFKRIYVHHGGNRTTDEKTFEKFDFVITTYGCLSSEYESAYEGGQLAYEERGPVTRFYWYRVILDEAHIIKNRQTKGSRAAFALKSQKRWCISGTPIQNNINELHTLISFLRFRPYSDCSYWKTLIVNNIKSDTQGTIKTLRGIVNQIILRRKKESVVGDDFKLPERRVDHIELKFSPQEQRIYNYIEKSAQREFRELVNTEQDVRENYLHILIILNRMRQACCHPLLVKWYGKEPGFIDDEINSDEEEKREEGEKFSDEIKLRLLQDVCSICLLDDEDVTDQVTTPCGHKFCHDCILGWLETHATCPNCWADVEEDELTPVAEVLNPKNFEEKREPAKGGSTKIRALMKELDIMINTTNDKCLIVSQWTSYLKLIQMTLQDRGIEFFQLDGTMSMQLRHGTIANFEDGTVRVLLVSMRAAGVGLNIVAANRVFTMDLWWNLAVENQVIDRVHRIGQTKDVVVKRFTVKDSIEERIILLQNQKKMISDCALSDANSHLSQRMDFDAFLHLFGLTEHYKPTSIVAPKPTAELE